MLAVTNYAAGDHEDLSKNNIKTKLFLDEVEDKRIHATMYPVNATNLYKACLAGVRRQKY
jgi:hypothetical protein